MQFQTYRLTSGSFGKAGWSILLLLVLAAWSCKKEEAVHTLPSVTFITGSGYTARDTVIVTGQKIRVGINGRATDGPITYFSIRLNDGTQKILLDTGMNRSELSYSIDIIKTSAPSETWTFFIMDRNRLKDSISIVLTKSDWSEWGKIMTFEDVVTGAQENADTGSFYSFSTGGIYDLGMAYANQPAIDLVYYFGQYDGTLASPSEAEAPGFFTGPEGIANWTVKNETRYDTTGVTPDDFDRAENDSLLLSVYEPTAGKRKTKFLQPGMVISFKSPAGKLGLIKISGIHGTTAGSLRFSVKIQE